MCERALFSLRMIQQSQQSSAMGSSSMTSLDHTGHSIAMEETKLHWKRGDKTYAMALMSKLLDTLKVALTGHAYVVLTILNVMYLFSVKTNTKE